MKKLISAFLALIFIFTLILPAAAAESASGATLRLEKTEGTVTVTKSSGKEVTVKNDMRLLSGYTVKTAAKSYAYISLDDTKAVKLDASSEATIDKSGKKLDINLVSGSIFFDVSKPLDGDEQLNIKTSTMITGIRGTSGVVTAKREKGVQRTVVALFDGALTVTTFFTDGTKESEILSAGFGMDSALGGEPFPLAPKDVPGFAAVEIAKSTDLQARLAEVFGEDGVGEIVSGAQEKLKADEAADEQEQSELLVKLDAQKSEQTEIDKAAGISETGSKDDIQLFKADEPTGGGGGGGSSTPPAPIDKTLTVMGLTAEGDEEYGLAEALVEAARAENQSINYTITVSPSAREITLSPDEARMMMASGQLPADEHYTDSLVIKDNVTLISSEQFRPSSIAVTGGTLAGTMNSDATTINIDGGSIDADIPSSSNPDAGCSVGEITVGSSAEPSTFSGNVSAKDFTVSANAKAEISGSIYVSGSELDNGLVSNSASSITVNSGASLEFWKGSLTGSVENNGSFDHISPDNSFDLNSCRFVNNGTFNAESMNIDNGSNFTNNSSGTITGYIRLNGNTASSSFTNSGTITDEGSSHSPGIDLYYDNTFLNYGTITNPIITIDNNAVFENAGTGEITLPDRSHMSYDSDRYGIKAGSNNPGTSLCTLINEGSIDSTLSRVDVLEGATLENRGSGTITSGGDVSLRVYDDSPDDDAYASVRISGGSILNTKSGEGGTAIFADGCVAHGVSSIGGGTPVTSMSGGVIISGGTVYSQNGIAINAMKNSDISVSGSANISSGVTKAIALDDSSLSMDGGTVQSSPNGNSPEDGDALIYSTTSSATSSISINSGTVSSSIMNCIKLEGESSLDMLGGTVSYTGTVSRSAVFSNAPDSSILLRGSSVVSSSTGTAPTIDLANASIEVKMDSAGTGKITNGGNGEHSSAIRANGVSEFSVQSGTISSVNSAGIELSQTVINISGGTIKSTNGSAIKADYCESVETGSGPIAGITITGGTISSTNGSAITGTGESNFEINGGTISSANANGLDLVYCTTNLLGSAAINAANGTGIKADCGDTLISGGTINAKEGANIANISGLGGSSAKITGGTINATTGNGITVGDSANVTIGDYDNKGTDDYSDDIVMGNAIIYSESGDGINATAASSSTTLYAGRIGTGAALGSDHFALNGNSFNLGANSVQKNIVVELADVLLRGIYETAGTTLYSSDAFLEGNDLSPKEVDGIQYYAVTEGY